ncbi:MAG: NADH:flavin oxidoreductase [Proteobacteria bacterium]|nr:NADH:flavin oxidoreductase [Pseudomonadota bacterium]
MNEKNSRLFEPVQIENLKMRSRIVMAPMTRNFSPNGIPGDDVADYYQRRAAAGVGLIITEGTTVDHKASNGYPNVPAFYGEHALDGWKKVVHKVHQEGGLIAPQLWHVGYIRKRGMEPDPDVPGYGPMEIKKGDEIETVGMTKDDIEEVTGAFASAAGSAREIGFDAVEIHGAHEYLIDQFFWEQSNQRTDEYGGSLENRLNFAIQIVKAARDAVGPDFPIIFRFSQWKQQDYKAKLANSPEELERFLMPLSNAGVDIFHASTRRFWEPEFEGSGLNLAGWARKITGKPAITVGSVGLDSTFTSSFGGKIANPTNLDLLNERLKKGEFDLVAVGRALLADAEWALKVKEGRENEIKPVDLKMASKSLS